MIWKLKIGQWQHQNRIAVEKEEIRHITKTWCILRFLRISVLKYLIRVIRENSWKLVFI
jgi:hypothetical protein